VKLTYYVPPVRMDDAVLELVTVSGGSLERATGQTCWHPAMHAKTNAQGGLNPDSYPHYVIVVVRGITEVFEHIHGPVFRVTDDEKLVVQAQESVAKGECRKEP
jgi:hypothetical protein